MSTQVEPVLRVDDLGSLPDDGNRYELMEGELFVSRAPSLIHQITVKNLLTIIQRYLDQDPIGFVVPSPGVIFSDLNAVIPDIALITNQRRPEIVFDERITGAPDLVIEVVSPGLENDKRDRIAKRQLYGRYQVREYWVVDPNQRSIEVYALEDSALKLGARYGEQDELASIVLPRLNFKVQSAFQF